MMKFTSEVVKIPRPCRHKFLLCSLDTYLHSWAPEGCLGLSVRMPRLHVCDQPSDVPQKGKLSYHVNIGNHGVHTLGAEPNFLGVRWWFVSNIPPFTTFFFQIFALFLLISDWL